MQSDSDDTSSSDNFNVVFHGYASNSRVESDGEERTVLDTIHNAVSEQKVKDTWRNIKSPFTRKLDFVLLSVTTYSQGKNL